MAKTPQSAVEVVLDDFPQVAVDPVGVGDDEDDAELVVGQEHGPEETVLLRDPFPGDIDEAPVVPDFIERAVRVPSWIRTMQRASSWPYY